MASPAVTFEHLFPDFPLERILYEDEDVIVIDKPVNVSTHAPDAGRSDDAFSRLKRALAARDRVRVEDVYLGIHQRLDRDTSGVLLFTRQKSANAAIAEQFEGRHVKKTYRAVVARFPSDREEGVLRDELVSIDGGRMAVVRSPSAAGRTNVVKGRSPGARGATFERRGNARSLGPSGGNRNDGGRSGSSDDRGAGSGRRSDRNGHASHGGAARGAAQDARGAARGAKGERREGRHAPEAPQGTKGGQLAVTRFRVLRRSEGRALVELFPETGRTHQLRVQLAAMGSPITGDRLYDGEPSTRLMLHAERLELRHPRTGKPLDVRAPLPPELDAWLAAPKVIAPAADSTFRTRLRAAIDARWAIGRSSDTTAFRLLDAAGDGVDGLCVDVYGEHLIAHFYSSEALAAKASVVEELGTLGARGVYIKVHPKQSNTLVDPRTEELAPKDPVRGEPAPDPLIITEGGLRYRVRLGDGLKTGLFLDQRDNRRKIRELARGKKVLNLFAYTCGFTVAAAAGGARSTVSVDSTRGVLLWGEENLAENGLAGDKHLMIADDAIVWLKHAAKRGDRYDIVILDPPSYATTKTSRFSAADDYADLASRALAVLAPGGILFACTNHRGISVQRFRKQLHEAGRLAERTLVQVKDLPCAVDFPAPIGSDPHLKCAIVTVK